MFILGVVYWQIYLRYLGQYLLPFSRCPSVCTLLNGPHLSPCRLFVDFPHSGLLSNLLLLPTKYLFVIHGSKRKTTYGDSARVQCGANIADVEPALSPRWPLQFWQCVSARILDLILDPSGLLSYLRPRCYFSHLLTPAMPAGAGQVHPYPIITIPGRLQPALWTPGACRSCLLYCHHCLK